MQRITLTLPDDLVSQAKTLCQGNFSQFVAKVLREHLESLKLQELRSSLEKGYRADAELDLAISEEFRYSDSDIGRVS